MEDLYIKEADKNDLEKERYELAVGLQEKMPVQMRCRTTSGGWHRLYYRCMIPGNWWKVGN